MPATDIQEIEITSKASPALSGEHFKPENEDLRNAIGKGKRLLSVDFYRGLIMVLLMIESSGFLDYLRNLKPGTETNLVMNYFFNHAAWHALHLWDLIQPGFMLIAGTSMAFSLYKQSAKGATWKKQAGHALRRSWWLFFWGVLDYAVVGNHLSFQLWDVLTQLSFTLLVAFLIFRWKTGYQLLFSLGLLVLTACLYRLTNVTGFNQPFTDQHNFGNYIDLILMDKINSGGWVAINCIPTAAHTIWGAVAGKWLLTLPDNKAKIKRIIYFGILLLLIGYGLDKLGITPVIKRIATTSFTLVSGGWCLIALALLYGWIDVLNHKRRLQFFTIVGMNCIFIYVFFEIVVSHWLLDYVNTIVNGVLSPLGSSPAVILIIAAAVIFGIEWYLCYWLYKKKIFFKV